MPSPIVSFCIPVMNRLSDLQATLRQNLDDNQVDRADVEFVVVCFDADTATADWVTAHFPHELATGYLRLHRSSDLRSWHFGRAKNAFRDLIRGRIYASLDGDNFTGFRGGRHIIDVFERHGYDCVFHQFQGDWGDGTCGRVSVNAEDYRSIGYDDHFLPRQWDELDLILSTLVQRPSRRYVCYAGKSILRKSQPFARFVREYGLQVETVEIAGEQDPLWQRREQAAVGKHASSYVQDDPRLKHSSVFNHLTSFFKNSADPQLKTTYANELVTAQREMARTLAPHQLVSWFLDGRQPDPPAASEADVVLAACLRNEPDLGAWLDHYRRLGVTRFHLIDDGSDEPILPAPLGPDVWVWTPKCGRFRYSKAFWLEILLRAHADGRWVITVDGDEYLDLPAPRERTAGDGGPRSPLGRLVSAATAAGARYFPAVLLDLVPGRDAWDRIERSATLVPRDFDHFQFRPDTPAAAYAKQNTVKWSYGRHAEWALRVDVRFRLNRALDSLRKFPLFRMGQDVHLNQGFHDLLIDGTKRSPDDLAREDVLVIRHYKLFASQADALSETRRPSDAYHPETSRNLKRLRAGLGSILRAAAASPFKYRYVDPRLVPTPGRTRLTLRTVDRTAPAGAASEPAVAPMAPTIEVVVCPREARWADGAIEAPSLEAAAEWVAANSPYCVVVDSSARSATLSIEKRAA